MENRTDIYMCPISMKPCFGRDYKDEWFKDLCKSLGQDVETTFLYCALEDEDGTCSIKNAGEALYHLSDRINHSSLEVSVSGAIDTYEQN